MVHLLKPNSVKILIDCGTEDMFYDINCALHEQLAFRRIPHDFISRPGNHNWPYWTNSVKYHLLFFDTYFKEEAESDSLAAAMEDLGDDYDELEVRLVRIKFLCEVAN
jgi:hypothetical protein